MNANTDSRSVPPNWLDAIGSEPFRTFSGVPLDSIRDCERSLRVCFPKRYREFLLRSDGAVVDLRSQSLPFFSIAPREEIGVTLLEINSVKTDPLFAIGDSPEMFGFLLSELTQEHEDLRVYELLHEEGEICLFARSFVELVTELSLQRKAEYYDRKFGDSDEPTSWSILDYGKNE
jgi:hypothetical protein